MRATRKGSTMGLRSWLRRLGSTEPGAGKARGGTASCGAAPEAAPAPGPQIAPGCPASEWGELPAYLPVDAAEYRTVCVIAGAIAAADRPQSEFRVTKVCVPSPEHRRVSVIAAAIAAGALPESKFIVKRIYKHRTEGEPHAA